MVLKVTLMTSATWELGSGLVRVGVLGQEVALLKSDLELFGGEFDSEGDRFQFVLVLVYESKSKWLPALHRKLFAVERRREKKRCYSLVDHEISLYSIILTMHSRAPE